MKTIRIVSLLLTIIVQFNNVLAQDSNLSCEELNDLLNKTEPNFYRLDKEQAQELLTQANSCTSPDAETNYYKARLALLHSNSRRKDKKTMNKLYNAYQAGHDRAGTMFAINFLTGKHVSLPIGARNTVANRVLAEIGNRDPLALYGLGYMNFKGINTANGKADYRKAKRYFEDSGIPMAKHWLAIMYYFGYDVGKDETKALELLSNNGIPNSSNLLNQLIVNPPSFISLTDNEEFLTEAYDTTSPTAINSDELNGTFKGTFIEYDYSQENVLRKTNFELQLAIDDNGTDNKPFEYLFKMGGARIVSGTGTINSDDLNFNELEFPLDKILKDHNLENNFLYRLKSIDLRKIIGNNNEQYFVGWIQDSENRDLKEYGRPTKIILEYEGPVGDDGPGADNFFTISPNPFDNNFQVNFSNPPTQGFSLDVLVAGQGLVTIYPTDVQTTDGVTAYTFDGSFLTSGLVDLWVNINTNNGTKIYFRKLYKN